MNKIEGTKMKLLRWTSACIILILLLVSCSSSQDFRADIIGQWDFPKFSNTYEFLENGTGSVSTIKDEQTFSVDISYEFTGGDEVVINYENGDRITFEISMPDSDTLVLTSTSPSQTFEMYRK